MATYQQIKDEGARKSQKQLEDYEVAHPGTDVTPPQEGHQ
jgi:hypothetical protein